MKDVTENKPHLSPACEVPTRMQRGFSPQRKEMFVVADEGHGQGGNT